MIPTYKELRVSESREGIKEVEMDGREIYRGRMEDATVEIQALCGWEKQVAFERLLKRLSDVSTEDLLAVVLHRQRKA